MEYTSNADDGTRIAYTVVGSGPPLLMVHGSFLTHTIWRTFGYVKALRATRTLILIDSRGHGRSEKPHTPDAYAMGNIVGDLTAVLDAVGAPTVDYLGYSFGARAGLALTAAAPERVRSLAVGGGSHGAQAGSFDRLFFPGCADVLEQRGMDGFLQAWNSHRMFPIDAGTRAVFSANDALAMAAYIRACDADPGLSDAALQRFTQPSLFYVGSEDGTRLDDTQAAAALVPNSELHLIRGFDHATTMAASEEVLGVLERFWDN
ncbi:alpha/beta hydrolase [Rhodococcus sp. IEGM 1381]|uniref:alpha/beta fold hydrolase n=1 Tax=Rhodococcus sp. IEGM 1381 TaxID=3047085 RepID=UPI0024B67930|nr:alpha/beta hydrolase [Rhodococcus sp. IEGM 1381]MDI9894055.1 alpha/beta hydrolase [Rhodococcus sp. IEGM 1381]